MNMTRTSGWQACKRSLQHFPLSAQSSTVRCSLIRNKAGRSKFQDLELIIILNHIMLHYHHHHLDQDAINYYVRNQANYMQYYNLTIATEIKWNRSVRWKMHYGPRTRTSARQSLALKMASSDILNPASVSS